MELEEMQEAWSEMTVKLEQQELLTNKLIMEMTQVRYKNKFNKISTYETIGAVVCFIAALYILFNFNKLDNWYLATCGLISLLYLIILPIAVLRSLNSIKKINLIKNSYKETLIDFAKRKKRMLFIQQLGIYINFAFLIFIIPVSEKILSDKDIFIAETNIWYWYVPIMSIVMILFSRWGYKCYKNIVNSAENTLKELEN